tara:strand:+ start:1966 stop:2253 length:288 start_codon:yes stop_codon:yes gene_type:complete
MTRYKMVNGERIQYTTEEETARDAEEKAWKDGEADRDLSNLREQRNSLLAKTDYMGNSDVTMSDEWKTYRQALRDITKTYKSIQDDGFEWPTEPS